MSVVKTFSSIRRSYRKSIQMSNARDMDLLEGAEEVGLNDTRDAKLSGIPTNN